MYGGKKETLFASDDSKEKYYEYLGKQASHITKHVQGASDREKLLNTDLKKYS